MEVDRAQSVGRHAARISADTSRPEAGALPGDQRAERLCRGVSRWDESGGLFRPGCGMDLRRRDRRAERPDRHLDARLAWPILQYHASNAQPHWITETMVTGKEPFNAERLLLSTGIVANNMESNWENGRYSAIGRRIETPFMNMTYRSTRGRAVQHGRAAAEHSLPAGIRQLGSDRGLHVHLILARVVRRVGDPPGISRDRAMQFVGWGFLQGKSRAVSPATTPINQSRPSVSRRDRRSRHRPVTSLSEPSRLAANPVAAHRRAPSLALRPSSWKRGRTGCLGCHDSIDKSAGCRLATTAATLQ